MKLLRLVPMARLQVDVSEEMKQRLKILSITRKTSMSELVESALEAFVPQLEAQTKSPS
jgi:hypothetical protein